MTNLENALNYLCRAGWTVREVKRNLEYELMNIDKLINETENVEKLWYLNKQMVKVKNLLLSLAI